MTDGSAAGLDPEVRRLYEGEERSHELDAANGLAAGNDLDGTPVAYNQMGQTDISCYFPAELVG